MKDDDFHNHLYQSKSGIKPNMMISPAGVLGIRTFVFITGCVKESSFSWYRVILRRKGSLSPAKSLHKRILGRLAS